MRTVTGGTSSSSEDFLHKLQEILSHNTAERRLQAFVSSLRGGFGHHTWVGVYLVRGEKLVLAAYAGNAETQHVTILMGQGICGSAAGSGETIIVPDVNKDSR